MKSDFIPHHIPDVIYFSVKKEEERRIENRMAQLKAGVNPHEVTSADYINTVARHHQAPDSRDDHYFRKQNILRGKLRHVKFISTKEMKEYAFKHRNSPISTLDED